MNPKNKGGIPARITAVHKGRFGIVSDFGIVAGESVGLPAPECLMVKELENGALECISGVIEYTEYKSLK